MAYTMVDKTELTFVQQTGNDPFLKESQPQIVTAEDVGYSEWKKIES